MDTSFMSSRPKRANLSEVLNANAYRYHMDYNSMIVRLNCIITFLASALDRNKTKAIKFLAIFAFQIIITRYQGVLKKID